MSNVVTVLCSAGCSEGSPSAAGDPVDARILAGAHGIPEPVESAPVIEKSNIDFALVPALAVDANGFRIGYGGGYYDRALPHLVNAFSCVVAYGFQVISEVPLFSDDAAVDAIVTDTAIIYVER